MGASILGLVSCYVLMTIAAYGPIEYSIPSSERVATGLPGEFAQFQRHVCVRVFATNIRFERWDLPPGWHPGFRDSQRSWEWLIHSWRPGVGTNWLGIGHFQQSPAASRPWSALDVQPGLLIVAIPFWIPLLISGLAPGLGALKVFCRWNLRSRRLCAGLCPGCGYDLRSTPDAEGPQFSQCPECGWNAKE